MIKNELINNIRNNKKFSFLSGKLLSSRVFPEFFKLSKKDKVANIGCGMGPQAIVYYPNYREMLGIDINNERIEKSKRMMEGFGINNYLSQVGNVEDLNFKDKSFDKVLAIDIIEHVQNPEKMCSEINRILKNGGQLLITFPAMHDSFVNFASWVGRVILRRKKKNDKNDGKWNPDNHNHEYSVRKWIEIVEKCGFELEKSRATTMFPPLHLYGVKRYWYSNDSVHKVDSFFCKIPIVKNLGQTMLCVFEKK